MTADPSEGRLLGVLEAAAPVDAGGGHRRAGAGPWGRPRARFLLADFSGRALVRLVVASLDGNEGAEASPDTRWARRSGRESTRAIPFEGGPMERVLRERTVSATSLDTGWQVLAPVTERGETLGLLELPWQQLTRTPAQTSPKRTPGS